MDNNLNNTLKYIPITIPAVLADVPNWFSIYFGPRYTKPKIRASSSTEDSEVSMKVGFLSTTYKHTDLHSINKNIESQQHISLVIMDTGCDVSHQITQGITAGSVCNKRQTPCRL